MRKAKLILTILCFIITSVTLAQTDGPGDPGPDPGTGGSPLGGGAPVGSGTLFLLGLAAAYGGKKAYDLNKGKRKN